MKKVTNTLVFILLTLMSLTFVYPLFFLAMTSVKPAAEYFQNPFALPKSINLDNFINLITRFNILDSMLNSFIVTIVSVFIIAVLGVFASFAFAKMRFRGKELIKLCIMMTLFIPMQVTMIPMYAMFSKLGLIDSYAGVIVSYVSVGLPSTIMLMTTFFKQIDNGILEAAKIDGAGYLRLTRHVIVPIGISGIIISIVTNFLMCWNDVFTPMILLPGSEKKTVMVAIASLMSSRTNLDPGYKMAGLLLSLLPTLIVYLIFQKFIMMDLSAGSVKG